MYLSTKLKLFIGKQIRQKETDKQRHAHDVRVLAWQSVSDRQAFIRQEQKGW